MNMEKEVLILNIEDVLPNRFQPRIKFKEENINELAESIKEHGVIQPIVVRKISDKYEIIAGERRYKASILAGKTTIPAIVTNLDDKNSAEVALIENVQRQNLTPIEEAISYKKILDMGYINQTDLAEKLGKTQSTIANKLRLLNLDEDVQEALLNEKISERHARSLLKLEKNEQVDMLNRIINERMTVRKTDEEINKLLNGVTSNTNNSFQTETTVETPILNSIVDKQDNSEIEVLDFDLNEQEPVKEENMSNLEKTMEIPIITEEEVNNSMNNNINQIMNNNNVNNEINPDINQNMNNEENNNQFNIPSEPIIENSVSEINSFTNNNVTDIPANNDVQPIENISNIPFNFDPINNQTAEIVQNIDFTQQQNPIDIATLSTQENNQVVNPEPIEINQNSPMMEVPQQNETESATTPSSGGKFFNMFNMNNQNYVDDIENKEVNMNFEEQSQPAANPFNFNFDPINNQQQDDNQPVQQNVGQPVIQSFETTKVQENPIDTPNIFNNSINNENEQVNIEDPFQNKLNPFTLNDDEQFTNPNEITSSSSSLEQFIPETNNQSIQTMIQPEINVQQQVSVNPQEKFVTGNLRMAINTIRDCASTIEKYGFNIETEELDFEDSYQVTFKIEKNN